jgi:hypothetical protein
MDLKSWYERQHSDLIDVVILIKGDLTKTKRGILGALITMDNHGE